MHTKINIEQLEPGDVFVVDRLNTKDHSNYNAGEYVLLRKTPFSLFAVKTTASVYELHSIQVFELAGINPWVVCAISKDAETVRNLIARVDREIVEVTSGFRVKQWVDYVYTSARANLYALSKIMADRQPAPKQEIDPTLVALIGDVRKASAAFKAGKAKYEAGKALCQEATADGVEAQTALDAARSALLAAI